MGDFTDDDDLEENPLFLAIKTRFQASYSLLERRGGLLCIPHSSVLRDVRLTQQLVDSHVFLPSPFFTGQFVSLGSRTAREESGSVTVSDELGVKKALVLNQEEVYSNEKSFRVLLIDSLLTDDVDRESPPAPSSSSSSSSSVDALQPSRQQVKLPSRPTFDKCVKFLTETTPTAIVAAKTKEQLRIFNQTYIFVRGFELHAVHKVSRKSDNSNNNLFSHLNNR